ncbi:copper chaperone PCu(A)C [Geodermatophilus sp. DSM 44513]|uniref:copper chaperone PCu(A)C n=1 Tax=Geodermatophilus sp. DSM 44513 TaxID=1528104 RepID=UPI00126DAD35|nr:copper chaperone PCu(A)C [Geodermatophilus sp. DSM 44513]WNV75223.1 copper chaperone PCu(A)C [Geodermatophilus sp. DSM 44513]
MSRAVKQVAIALCLLVLMVLTGCSAGQVTQTATQDRDKTGGFGSVGDVTIRAVRLAYPPEGVYRPGDQAELMMAIVNSGWADDELLSITGDFFTGVTVNGEPSTPAASTVIASDAPAAQLHADRASSTAGESSGSAGAMNLPIPADEAVFVGMGGPSVVLTGLTAPIDAAQSVQLTLTFARAGQTTVTAIVAPAPEPLPREPIIAFQPH